MLNLAHLLDKHPAYEQLDSFTAIVFFNFLSSQTESLTKIKKIIIINKVLKSSLKRERKSDHLIFWTQ